MQGSQRQLVDMEESEELDLDLEGGNNNSVLSSSSTPRRPSQPPPPTITVSVTGINSEILSSYWLNSPLFLRVGEDYRESSGSFSGPDESAD